MTTRWDAVAGTGAGAAASSTLSSNVVTSVTVTDPYQGFQVVNRSQTGTIWVRYDGTNPTVAGTDCHPVLGVRFFPVPGGTTVTVKLIANAALDYSVEGGAPA